MTRLDGVTAQKEEREMEKKPIQLSGERRCPLMSEWCEETAEGNLDLKVAPCLEHRCGLYERGAERCSIEHLAAETNGVVAHLASIANSLMNISEDTPSLRDRFAEKILPSIIMRGADVGYGADEQEKAISDCVELSYKLADAMIVARSANEPEVKPEQPEGKSE